MKNLGAMGNVFLFIGAVLFVILFQIIFGVENGLIGVSTVMASLTMLRRNLTIEPIKNGITLVLLNVVLGVASILALESFWLGVILTFLIFFFLGYFLLYSLNKPLYLPFALEYLYLLLTPIPNSLLPLRIISLAVGGVIIIIINFLYYNKKNPRDEDQLIIDLCNIIVNKCNLIINNESPAKLEGAIEKIILQIRRVIYDKNRERFSLTDEAAVKLALVNGLEKLNDLIPDLHNYADERYILKEIAVFLNTIESGLKIRNLFELEDALYKIKLREDNKNNYSSSCLSVINLLGFIHGTIGEIINLTRDSKKAYNTISDNNIRLTLNDSKMPIFSFKFYFALRIALGMALATLVSGFFTFSEGIWALSTTFAIMVPLYSNDKKSIRYEVRGTILGALISYLIFSIFNGATLGTLIILICSYFYGIFEGEFKYSGVLISICAFGVGFVSYGSSNIFSVNIFFLLGTSALISIIFESLLFPYDFNKATSDLAKIYGNILMEFLEEVHNITVGEKHSDIINSLLMFLALLEERMLFNNEHLKDEKILNFVKYQRTLLYSIYELYLWMDNNDLATNTKSAMNKFITMLLSEELLSKHKMDILSNNSYNIGKSLEDKVALNTLYEISTLIFNLKP